jgi:hypothetical protein
MARPHESVDAGPHRTTLDLERFDRASGSFLVEPAGGLVALEFDHRLVPERTADPPLVPRIADELGVASGMDQLDLVFHPSDVEPGEVADPPPGAGQQDELGAVAGADQVLMQPDTLEVTVGIGEGENDRLFAYPGPAIHGVRLLARLPREEPGGEQ